MRLDAVLVGVLGAHVVDLKGGVVDVVPLEQDPLEFTADGVAIGSVGDDHVGRQRRLARGDLPDVQVVHLCHRADLGELGADGRGVDALGAASRKMRPLARTRPQPALTMSAATTSAAMASARAKPVSQTTAPAIAVAMKAYRSLRMCW